MNRRSFLSQIFTFAAAAVGLTVASSEANADVLRVRHGVARWVRHHRRYLRHHLPRRRLGF